MIGFEYKKSLGQNFLTSDVVPKWMCDAGDVISGDVVLEIGPGAGALTSELLSRGAHVVAVEADPRALDILHKRFKSYVQDGQLRLHHGDAREIEPFQFGLKKQGYKVIANIPYFLSGFLFRQLLTSSCQPEWLVFLLQKEVAERIAREPKSSLLSISVKVYGSPRYVRSVSKGHFTPQPKIDSAILSLTNISKKHFSNFSEETFFTILRSGFAQKRKQLSGNLSSIFTREEVQHTLTTLSLPPTARAEDLNELQWLALIKTLAN